MNPLTFEKVKCIPPDPRSSGSQLILSQHLEHNTKLQFKKLKENKRKKKDGVWWTSDTLYGYSDYDDLCKCFPFAVDDDYTLNYLSVSKRK